ncbi:TlpA family protein disulfide reductase [Roseomonas marmotae]|uniref:TlpA family protein disulfide reductase n=1 Tax=Roseomonas marmotae TaxID=2768161 RepID=A0ABS3K981_9PROT|nr:TlpA disulfide reductase family protein [Roseomonas marmotae]MBO1074022.1 TlpA family protein disulfide reductase [Roseomonas marmotae]QTI78809.1 TlpA family protein disulfide reductase [Roseomonas marmotae]
MAAARTLEPVEPKPLPPLRFTDAEGKPYDLGAFPGQMLLINLWATWCPPCVKEMPSLERAQDALKDEGWTVLPLSSDRGGREKVEPFYKRIGLKSLGIWLDPQNTVARALGARGLPTTIVVDRQQREVARLEGEAEWDSSSMLEALRKLGG